MAIKEFHSLDACNKCYCPKKHRELSIDSVSKEKIVSYYWEKGLWCRCNIDDGTCHIKVKSTQYYQNGKKHIRTISRNSFNAWQPKGKTETVVYDKNQRKTLKTISKRKNGKEKNRLKGLEEMIND